MATSKNPFHFLTRAAYRAIAQAAYRTLMTRGAYVRTIQRDGIDYRVDVHLDLNCVFIDHTAPTGENKTAVVKIAKCWIN